MSVPLRTSARIEPHPEAPVVTLVRADVARDARILIIDDQPANIDVLKRILRSAGFVLVNSTTDPLIGVELAQSWNPDLVLLDLHMPLLDGFGVLEAIRPQLSGGGYLPVLMLTADSSDETKRRVLAGGVKDFLTKPFDATEVVLRIGNLLETRSLYTTVRKQNELLEERVAERTRQLEEAQVEILQRLASGEG